MCKERLIIVEESKKLFIDSIASLEAVDSYKKYHNTKMMLREGSALSVRKGWLNKLHDNETISDAEFLLLIGFLDFFYESDAQQLVIDVDNYVDSLIKFVP